MLMVTCQAGGNRFAVDSAVVTEVLPHVAFDELADAPPWFAGICVYRGVAIPVVDFPRFLTGQACPRRWNSRIILVQVAPPGPPVGVGLLAERVTTAEIDVQKAATAFAPMDTLGPILLDGAGAFRLLDVSRLFSQHLCSSLPTLADREIA